MIEELKITKEANKEILNSISVEDILKEEKMTSEDLESRAESADGFYTVHFDKVLKKMMYEELMRLGKEAQTSEELLFSRGVILGFGLIQDWFEKQLSISREKLQDKENE